MIKTRLFLLMTISASIFWAFDVSAQANKTDDELVLIPKPAELELHDGNFTFDESTVFVIEDEEQERLVQLLGERFKTAAGFPINTSKDAPKRNYIEFRQNDDLGDEAYTLIVANGKIEIGAKAFSGRLYALETIRQLLPDAIESDQQVENVNWTIPNLTIKDEPRFGWRGLMLDVSRHFFKKDYILKTIDRLAMLKMNTLHLHLVDDQGWRVEIKKYPKLTEVGAWRVDQEEKHWNARSENKPGDKATYGGFYTQDDIKEIVAYAKEHGVTVVPEIEMPAHVMSAIAAYPELSCTGKPIAIPSGGVWPITDIYCAGKDSTFDFLEDVLLEVMDIFPSKYIHIGGDEATKTEWETCASCQQRMKDEGLENVEELQSYFMKRIERFISSHDRILIGWDEILEGGLAPGATVMSWRGIDGGWKASKQGHDVVMTPGSPLYLNIYQRDPDSEPIAQGGYNPLKLVYDFDPIVDSMTVEQKKHVLGGQANLWSEFISTDSHSEYMLFPRLAAAAEIFWTPQDKQNWEDFSPRIQQMLHRFELMGINYSHSAYDVTVTTEIDLKEKSLKVILNNEFPNTQIRYVTGDEQLNAQAKLYEGSIAMNTTSKLKAGVFKDGKVLGDTLVKTFHFHKAVGKKVAYEPEYNDQYQGQGAVTVVNVLRGSKNFHDGQWVAWLGKDAEISINLDKKEKISQVTVGSMEDQGSGIYFPVNVEVFLSQDGTNYESVGNTSREFENNGYSTLKDFKVNFKQKGAQYVRVKITNLETPPNGGGSWMFIDEVIVE